MITLRYGILESIKEITAVADVSVAYPTDDLIMHLDADDLSSVYSNNDTVTVWRDISGEGNDASVASGNAPVFKTNQLNSLPAVYFSSETGKFLNTPLNVTNAAKTIFLVVKNDLSEPPQSSFFGIGTGTTLQMDIIGPTEYYHHWYTHLNSPPELNFNVTYGSGSGSNNTTHELSTSELTSWMIYGCRTSYGGSDPYYVSGHNLYHNNTTVTGSDWALMTGPAYANIFREVQGYAAEIMFYDRKLTDTEVGEVKDYLNDKWDIYT